LLTRYTFYPTVVGRYEDNKGRQAIVTRQRDVGDSPEPDLPGFPVYVPPPERIELFIEDDDLWNLIGRPGTKLKVTVERAEDPSC
jgi:hypothetical protein